VARRLLNWSLPGAVAPPLRAHLAPWMAAQMRFLAGHLERHLLGNHLLCDLCGLVAAADLCLVLLRKDPLFTTEPRRLAALGASGRRYAEENYSRPVLAARYAELLAGIVSR
jgi:hypothetical protein